MNDKPIAGTPNDSLTRHQIEAFRKEHLMHRHINGEELELWAIEENRVLNALCDNALRSLKSESAHITDDEIQQWADRHNLRGDLADLREAFRDARSIVT